MSEAQARRLAAMLTEKQKAQLMLLAKVLSKQEKGGSV